MLFANDDFFAPKENLLKAGAPVFIEGKYPDLGKWMEGWETRRRRTPGFDWCIIRLGLPGIIRGVVVDTSFFRGNYPEHCSIEACTLDGLPTTEELLSESSQWTQILPQLPLTGDTQNPFGHESEQRFTHCGSRFPLWRRAAKSYGEVAPDWVRITRWATRFAAVRTRYRAACIDMFFGTGTIDHARRAANMTRLGKKRPRPVHD